MPFAFLRSTFKELTIQSVVYFEAIHEGDALSIDYGNFFYQPTSHRQEELQESYEFVCACPGCTTEPDLCRAFQCPSKACQGLVCPIGKGQLLSEWACLTCKRSVTTKERKAFLAAEEELEESPLESAEEINEVCAPGWFRSENED